MRVCGGVVNADAIDEVGVEFVERSKWMLLGYNQHTYNALQDDLG